MSLASGLHSSQDASDVVADRSSGATRGGHGRSFWVSWRGGDGGCAVRRSRISSRRTRGRSRTSRAAWRPAATQVVVPQQVAAMLGVLVLVVVVVLLLLMQTTDVQGETGKRMHQAQNQQQKAKEEQQPNQQHRQPPPQAAAVPRPEAAAPAPPASPSRTCGRRSSERKGGCFTRPGPI
eukprot:COSAG04_NODE_735_length_10705_cov_33.479823_9_plen_179_part_00